MTSQIVIIYILKTILISGIFLAYYWIALRDKKFHYYNRFYLLTASIVSLVIPLLKFNWFTVEEPVLYSSNKIIQYILPISNANESIQFDWIDYSLVIAGIVAITLFSILLLNVIKIQLLKRKWDVTPMEGFDFINTNDDNAPFSFLNNLFWKQSISLKEEGGQQIFKHEITHIQQKHTWDRIYCQILTSILWMNPFNWIIQKELVTIHEFIADEAAVGNSNVEAFAKMLLQTHYGNHFLNPTHQFFYSSIKRRLAMLTKSTNTKYSYLRRVIILPILIVTVCLVSIKVNAGEKLGEIKNEFSLLVSDTSKPTKKSSVKSLPAPPAPPTPPKVNKTDSKGNKITVTYKTSVDTIIVVGDANNNRNINKNTFTTVYDTKDKQVAKANLIKSRANQEKSKADQIKSRADQIKSRADQKKSKADQIKSRADQEKSKADQIKSRADQEKSKADQEKSKADQIKSRADQENNPKIVIKPAYYLNGVKITEKEMKAISPNDIESINILKGEQAIKKYPEDGKTGVVEIKLKQKN